MYFSILHDPVEVTNKTLLVEIPDLVKCVTIKWVVNAFPNIFC